eukprot:Phypoly_transcript_17047.p1 GENE.Phypoly_transcript_17047~~Phypoly_transcript_17047.p1  ORF type:complete len:162 (-),score=8.27 Phypoly_transcript_17047:197-682(-)
MCSWLCMVYQGLQNRPEVVKGVWLTIAITIGMVMCVFLMLCQSSITPKKFVTIFALTPMHCISMTLYRILSVEYFITESAFVFMRRSNVLLAGFFTVENFPAVRTFVRMHCIYVLMQGSIILENSATKLAPMHCVNVLLPGFVALKNSVTMSTFIAQKNIF